MLRQADARGAVPAHQGGDPTSDRRAAVRGQDGVRALGARDRQPLDLRMGGRRGEAQAWRRDPRGRQGHRAPSNPIAGRCSGAARRHASAVGGRGSREAGLGSWPRCGRVLPRAGACRIRGSARTDGAPNHRFGRRS